MLEQSRAMRMVGCHSGCLAESLLSTYMYTVYIYKVEVEFKTQDGPMSRSIIHMCLTCMYR